MNGPLSPDELAQMQSYYEGQPGVNMSAASAPAMSTAAAPPPDPAASYYAPPPAPAALPMAPPPPAAVPVGSDPLDSRTPEQKAVDDYYGAVAPTDGGYGNPSSGPVVSKKGPDGKLAPIQAPPSANAPFPGQAPTAPVVGPSQQDDDALAAFIAKTKAKPAAPAGGGSGFGNLQKDVNAANKHLMGTYDEQMGLARHEGEIRSAHDAIIASRQQEIARLQQEDAAIASATEADAQTRFQDQMDQVQGQLDEVREQKIDPMKWREGKGVGLDFMMVLGAVGAGLYQAVHGGDNQFLKELNTVIDRSIRTQKDNIASQRDSALDKMNLLNQQRAIYKDHTLAEMQTRNMMLEGAKTQLLADAASSDSVLVKNESQQKASAIDQEKAKLMKGIADTALHNAQAAAASEAAQKRAMLKEARETNIELMKLELRREEIAGKTNEKGNKRVERFVANGVDEQGNPTGYLARNPETAAKEEDARKAREELFAEIDDAMKVRAEAGTLGRTLNREGAAGLWKPEWQGKLDSKKATIMAKWNKAQQMGTMDSGTKPLLDAVVGQLDSAGESSDIRLKELRGQLERSNDADKRVVSGQRVKKVIGPDGEEDVVPLGTAQNAPNNPRAVPREPVR